MTAFLLWDSSAGARAAPPLRQVVSEAVCPPVDFAPPIPGRYSGFRSSSSSTKYLRRVSGSITV